jgi:hypothetical protein
VPLVVLSCYSKFHSRVQSEQSERKVWNFRYVGGQISDFAAKSRSQGANSAP